MFGKKNKTNWGQVIGALAVLKIMPVKKTVLGVAALAGAAGAAAYALKRRRAATATT